MTTTTSSSKKTENGLMPLSRSIAKRFFGVTLLAFIIEFLILPLQYVIALSNGNLQDAKRFMHLGFILLQGMGIFFALFVLVLPVVYTALSYSYLYSRNATDLYHSLPIKREKLLLTNFVSSAVLIAIPAAINVAVTVALLLSLGMPLNMVPGYLMAFIVVLAGMLGTLAVATIAAVTVGTAFDYFVVTGGLTFLAPIILFTGILLGSNVYGFQPSERVARIFGGLSPVVMPFISLKATNVRQGSQTFYYAGLIIWVILTVLLVFAAMWLYKRRKSELASVPASGGVIQLAIKLLCSTLAGLVFSFGIRLATNSGDSLMLSTILAFIGGGLCFAVMEALTSRGFKTLLKRKEILATAALLPTVLVVISMTGALGYERYVPNPNSVREITVYAQNIDRYSFRPIEKDRNTRASVTLTSDECRLLVNELNLAILENNDDYKAKSRGRLKGEVEREPGESYYTRKNYTINYTLNSGMTLSRQYQSRVPDKRLIDAMMALSSSDEFLAKTHPIFKIEPQEVYEITVTSKVLTGAKTLKPSEADSRALLEALTADMLEENVTPDTKILGYVRIDQDPEVKKAMDYRYFIEDNYGAVDTDEVSNKIRTTVNEMFKAHNNFIYGSCYVGVTEEYKNTLAVLGRLGIGEALNAVAEDIESVYLSIVGASNELKVQGPDSDVIENNLYVTERMTLHDYSDAKTLEYAKYESGASDIMAQSNDRAVVRITDKAEIQNVLSGISGTNHGNGGSVYSYSGNSGYDDGLLSVSATVEENGGKNLVRNFTVSHKQLSPEILKRVAEAYEKANGMQGGTLTFG